MALGKELAGILESLYQREGPRESILMLGRQEMAIPKSEIRNLASLCRHPDRELAREIEADGYADNYLHHLGFKQVSSLDFSSYEDCSLVHDLNAPIPEFRHQYADVVLDGGTLEHIFHFPNAITNAMNLVKEGGYYIAGSPTNNYSGHGFYQFSPELYFRIFQKENGFEVKLMALAESKRNGNIYRISDPEALGHRITFGGVGPLQTFMVAQRIKAVAPLRTVPQQSDYTLRWRASAGEKEEGSGHVSKAGQFRKAVSTFVRRHLPDKWMEVVDTELIARRRRREQLRGIEAVAKIDECWLS